MRTKPPKASKLPVPTGDPWKPSWYDPATVPVPYPVLVVSVEGPYTEQDRKLWTFLLHMVWDELEGNAIHERSVKEINRVFRELGGDHNTEWIWESSERLTRTIVQWRYTEGDTRYKGISGLFGAVLSKEARSVGKLRFSFPALLVPILKDPRRYARLRTHFLVKLSGKYAVTMYELLEAVANKEVPILVASVDQLRQWLKVPDGKLLRGPDFRRFVLEPALQQINTDPEGAGFTVDMQLQKEGRAIKWVQFTVTKTPEREALEASLAEKARPRALADAPLRTSTYEQAKKLAYGWDIYVLAAQWQEWGKKQQDWPPANPDGAFLGFCKNRGPAPGR
jgi:hypothetical protein